MAMKTKEQIIEELQAIYDYMDSKDAVYGFGQIGDLINKLKSELTEKESEVRTAKEILERFQPFYLNGNPSTGCLVYVKSDVERMLELISQFKQPVTDGEKEAIEFIAENPDCEKYWLANVKNYLDDNGEATDDSCQLSDEWQKQFEIAINAFLKWVLSPQAQTVN